MHEPERLSRLSHRTHQGCLAGGGAFVRRGCQHCYCCCCCYCCCQGFGRTDGCAHYLGPRGVLGRGGPGVAPCGAGVRDPPVTFESLGGLLSRVQLIGPAAASALVRALPSPADRSAWQRSGCGCRGRPQSPHPLLHCRGPTRRELHPPITWCGSPRVAATGASSLSFSLSDPAWLTRVRPSGRSDTQVAQWQGQRQQEEEELAPEAEGVGDYEGETRVSGEGDAAAVPATESEAALPPLPPPPAPRSRPRRPLLGSADFVPLPPSDARAPADARRGGVSVAEQQQRYRWAGVQSEGLSRPQTGGRVAGAKRRRSGEGRARRPLTSLVPRAEARVLLSSARTRLTAAAAAGQRRGTRVGRPRLASAAAPQRRRTAP